MVCHAGWDRLSLIHHVLGRLVSLLLFLKHCQVLLAFLIAVFSGGRWFSVLGAGQLHEHRLFGFER